MPLKYLFLFFHVRVKLNSYQLPSLLHPSHIHIQRQRPVHSANCSHNAYALPLLPQPALAERRGNSMVCGQQHPRGDEAEPSSGWASRDCALVVSARGSPLHMFITFPEGHATCSNAEHSICSHCASETINNCKRKALEEDHTTSAYAADENIGGKGTWHPFTLQAPQSRGQFLNLLSRWAYSHLKQFPGYLNLFEPPTKQYNCSGFERRPAGSCWPASIPARIFMIFLLSFLQHIEGKNVYIITSVNDCFVIKCQISE